MQQLQMLFQMLQGFNLTQLMDKWVWDLSDEGDFSGSGMMRV